MTIQDLSRMEDFLRTQGQRVTTRRRMILKEILGIHRHFTAEDLYERTRRAKSPPSKATVYRMLALLVEGSLLETHQFGDRYLYYEIAVDRKHHDHMMCVECGHIVEFASAELESIQQRILDRHGFTMVHHSHKIYGLCKTCHRGGKKIAGAPARKTRGKPRKSRPRS